MGRRQRAEMTTPAKKRTHTPMVATEAGAAMTLLDGGVIWAASEEHGWLRGRILSVGGSSVDVQSIARPFAEEVADRGRTLAPPRSTFFGRSVFLSTVDEDDGRIVLL